MEEQKGKKTYKKRTSTPNHPHRIYLRVSDEEFKRLKEKSKDFGTMSKYLRMLLISSKKTIIEPRTMIKSISELSGNINRVGNNINQLAKAVNIAEKSGIVDYSIIERCREEIMNYTRVLDVVASVINNMYK